MRIICKCNKDPTNHAKCQRSVLLLNPLAKYMFIFLCLHNSELKPQYVEQSSNVTNMNELPHLLQAILQLKQNVFKTGGQQYQLQRPRKCRRLRSSINCIFNLYITVSSILFFTKLLTSFYVPLSFCPIILANLLQFESNEHRKFFFAFQFIVNN